MPELCVAPRCWPVPAGSNLLDALNSEGFSVPYSCRAGSCHACMVRCVAGEPQDNLPEALAPALREQGWRLACQCQVQGDLRVQLYDPTRDGIPGQVVDLHWCNADVLRLRLQPERRLRYQAGAHVVLWCKGIARPYSLASLLEADPWLEFHIDCGRAGAFSDAIRETRVGDVLELGEVRGGALHYDAQWQDAPLWLLAAGTGLAPLWGVLREALRQHHHGPIRLVHLANEAAGHYWRAEFQTLVEEHPQVQVECVLPDDLPKVISALSLRSRKTHALVCGSPASVEAIARRLYLAGVPRNQVFSDLFLTRSEQIR